MNRFFRDTTLLVSLLLIMSIRFTGQPPRAAQAPEKIKVFLQVDCKDEDTKTLMQRWLKRDLRRFGDVVIVAFNDASYILKIVAVESEYKEGGKTGNIAVGVNFLQVCPTAHPVSCFFDPKLLVFSYGREALEKMCQDIVAEFDTQTLQPARHAREIGREIGRELLENIRK